MAVQRSAVAELLQLGVESTPGTAVAAAHRIAAFDLASTIDFGSEARRAAGYKYPVQVVPGKESTTFSLSGLGDYVDLGWILASAVDDPTSVTGTTATTHTFESAEAALDAPLTYTVEQGQSAQAHEVAHVMFTGVGIEFTRDAVNVDGSAIGGRIDNGITLTSAGSVADNTARMITPNEVSIYVDTSQGNLGNTKPTDVVPRAKFMIDSRFAGAWDLDAAKTSWADYTETEPTGSIEMLVAADSDAAQLLTDARTVGTTKWVRIEAVSANANEIDTGETWTLTIDAACQVSDIGAFSDDDGVYALQYTLTLVNDDTWGKAFSIALVNDLADYA